MTLVRRYIEELVKNGAADLFARADAARRKWCGDAVHVRGIIEFSNICSRNCAYCGLRRDNIALPRYTISAAEILDITAHAHEEGVRTIVLQSGENDSETAERLAHIIFAIKHGFDMAVTLCVGAKSPDFYKRLREAGADRYLLKHETANPLLYNRLHPDSSLRQRIAALDELRALGYQVGCGCIIGLPTQTPADLADDILLTHELDVDMAAFGPFVPHPNTPLMASAAGTIDFSLRVIAVARLILGPVHIPATTAFDAIASDGRERALRCGANVIMANLTPDRYRSLYDIYPSNRSANSIQRVKSILARLDRPLALDHGHSLKRRKERAICSEPQKV